MKIYRRPGLSYAALVGLLFSTVAPTLADDPANRLPSETMAYVGWDAIIDDSNAGLLQAVQPLLELAGEQPPQEFLMALPLVEKSLRGDGAVALLDLTWDGGPMPIFAIVINGPGRDILNTMDQLHGDVSEEAVGGVQVKSGGGFTWGLSNDTFFFCSSSASETVIDALVDSSKSLRQNPRFAKARTQARVKKSDWQFSAYSDVSAVLTALKERSEKAGDPAPPKFWESMDEAGMLQIQSGLLHWSGEDEYTVTRVFLGYEGEPKGILKLWENGAVTGRDLNRVPANAYWASVCNFDLGGIWEEAARVIGQVDDEMLEEIEGGDAMAASMLGFSPTRDLLPLLGDTWIWYDAPAHGGFIFTGAALQVESSDPPALRAIFARLLQIASPVLASQDIKMQVAETDHNGHTIEYLSIPGMPIPIAPSVAYHGDFAIVALTPQTVKAALNHLDKPEKLGGLASHPEMEATQAKLGGPLQAVYYTDTKYVTQLGYGLNQLVQIAATSLAGGDIASLPTLDEVLAKMGASVGGCRRVEGGVLYENYAKGGIPAVMPTNAALIGLMGGILIPSLSQAREQAKQVVSMTNLRTLGMACHIFAADHKDAFPNSIEEAFVYGELSPEILIAPSDWQEDVTQQEIDELRRNGFLTKDNPGSGILRSSYVFVPGQTTKSDRRNVLMYEKSDFADEPAALFVDGHVERLGWYQLGEKLKETYERLGRPEDLPDEFR